MKRKLALYVFGFNSDSTLMSKDFAKIAIKLTKYKLRNKADRKNEDDLKNENYLKDEGNLKIRGIPQK